MAVMIEIAPLANSDALVLNFRAPAAGNYFVEVTSATTDFGFYDLLFATWSPTSTPWRNAARQLDVDNDYFVAPVDALLVILTPQAMTDPTQAARTVIELAHKSDKPLVTCWMGEEQVREARHVGRSEVPCGERWRSRATSRR